jgi:hypothetical protein
MIFVQYVRVVLNADTDRIAAHVPSCMRITSGVPGYRGETSLQMAGLYYGASCRMRDCER